jgi:CDP-glycerol glycerophosphotransferase (TagB/SpsB family)
VILSPLINPASTEADYLQAALALKIPSVYALYSWDNLTSKGTFHSVPDHSFVWSRSLALDLAKWHNIPPQQIIVTGAPRFDPWFEGKLSQDRNEFCKLAGLDPQKPFVLYVCSTFLVDSNYKKEVSEATIISEISSALQQHPEIQDFQILVRPHPTNSQKVVESIIALNDAHVHVYPLRGEFPDSDERRRILYNSIHHSQAVVGVNTTAFLEAAILDKPCITIWVPRFEQTQMLPHFHHLADADFLDTANGSHEVPKILIQLMEGRDERAGKRRRFVKDFIRPHGIEKPAAEAYADVIEKIFSKEEGSSENYGL